MTVAVFDAFITEAQMEFLSPNARRDCVKFITSDFGSILAAKKVVVETGPLSNVERPSLLEHADEYDYSNRVWEVVITEDMVSHLSKNERTSLFKDLWTSLQGVSADWGLDWNLNSKDTSVRERTRKFWIEQMNS